MKQQHQVMIDEHGYFMDVTIAGVVQRFRWIPSGEFMMGSPEDEPGRFDDERQHEESVEGFWLADTACTQELWQVVIGDNPSHFKGPQQPVETVSLFDTLGFIEKLNDMGEVGKFRLPTETEWEYACRAGTTTPYSYGGQITKKQVNFNSSHTVDVKSLPCNDWGLFEMHGNVWEWTSSLYQEKEEEDE